MRAQELEPSRPFLARSSQPPQSLRPTEARLFRERARRSHGEVTLEQRKRAHGLAALIEQQLSIERPRDDFFAGAGVPLAELGEGPARVRPAPRCCRLLGASQQQRRFERGRVNG